MFVEFESYIKEKAAITDDEIMQLGAAAIDRTLHKKALLSREGAICPYKIFVVRGLLRSYQTKDDGSEHIIQFCPEHNWLTDPDSFTNLTPSMLNIDALEDTEVMMWTKKDFDMLMERMPSLHKYSTDLIYRNMTLNRKRLYSAISATAEEKYDDFINTYPDIFARVPLHMVASYLGVSRETLSRIRQAQMKR